MKAEKLITIFTPTFNRKKELQNCYESLLNQTSNNFKWLIIDDGSNDETNELVEEWKLENKINIEYIYVPNKGKASAINDSFTYTNTELWLCLDSDDYLTSDAIRIIEYKYPLIESNQGIIGFLGLRHSPDGSVMKNQNSIPSEYKYGTLGHVRYSLKIETEYVFVYKTKIIKNYKYPIINGEKFIPLSYVFDKIDRDYQYSILHEKIMISEYLEDGITSNKTKLIKKNTESYKLYLKNRYLNTPYIGLKIKSILQFGSLYFINNRFNIAMLFKNTPSKILSILLLPVSYIIYRTKYK